MKTGRSMMRVCQLNISPGHSFFGHHGQPAGESPLIERAEICCVAGRGIRGDRFFDDKDNYKGQITFFSSEVFEEVCDQLDVSGKTAGATRRNVITTDADLNSLVGQEFEMQGVRFAGTANGIFKSAIRFIADLYRRLCPPEAKPVEAGCLAARRRKSLPPDFFPGALTEAPGGGGETETEPGTAGYQNPTINRQAKRDESASARWPTVLRGIWSATASRWRERSYQ
jgi:hypothetical protein